MADTPAETPALDLKDIEARLRRGPFHQWLGLTVESVAEGRIELKARWREEWIVNPDGRYTHGGILATLIDLTADWALVSKSALNDLPGNCGRVSEAVSPALSTPE